MDLTTLGIFTVADLLFSLTPGPAVLYVISTGLSRGPAASLWANGGILLGNLTYFIVSATGLVALIFAAYEVFFLVKWLGVAFLVWMGLSTFFGKSPAFKARKDGALPRSGPRILMGGAFLQLANPKAILFFTAFLPQFIDPERPIILQFVILAAISLAVEAVCLLMYGTLAGQAARLAERPGVAKWIDRTAGGFLIVAAGLMATIRRA